MRKRSVVSPMLLLLLCAVTVADEIRVIFFVSLSTGLCCVHARLLVAFKCIDPFGGLCFVGFLDINTDIRCNIEISSIPFGNHQVQSSKTLYPENIPIVLVSSKWQKLHW